MLSLCWNTFQKRQAQLEHFKLFVIVKCDNTLVHQVVLALADFLLVSEMPSAFVMWNGKKEKRKEVE